MQPKSSLSLATNKLAMCRDLRSARNACIMRIDHMTYFGSKMMSDVGYLAVSFEEAGHIVETVDC